MLPYAPIIQEDISFPLKGNLAAGISTESFVTVYSPDGSKLSEFLLIGKPIPVTKSIIRRYKANPPF